MLKRSGDIKYLFFLILILLSGCFLFEKEKSVSEMICKSNSDCADGEVCEDGRCVVPPDNIPPSPPDISKIILHQNPPGTPDSISGLPGAVEGSAWVVVTSQLDGIYSINIAQIKADSDGGFQNIYIGDNLFDNVQIYVKDTAGNMSMPVTLFNDIKPPDTLITKYPFNKSEEGNAEFEFICNEDNCIFECALDGYYYSECTPPVTYTCLNVGEHTFYVRAKDLAGNIDEFPDSYKWEVTGVGSWYYPPNLDNSLISGRINHTAIWTGSEMIIWGGYSDDPGGKYDPITDMWNWVSSINAPESRYNHSAVWTGTEMIIWGGRSLSNDKILYNSGGKYNPSTDSWMSTSLINATIERASHTAVWTGTKMIIWGGYNLTFLNDGGSYDPVADTWENISSNNAPSPRAGATGVWTGSEMIVWGGFGLSGWNYDYLNTGGRYNPVSDLWMPLPIPGAPTKRISHTAIWTGTEMIIWGGSDYTNGQFHLLNTGGIYNPTTNKWRQTSNLCPPSGRDGHTAVWSGKYMIIFGGFGGFNDGGLYDPLSDRWLLLPRVREPSIFITRYAHTAIWIGNSMIVWGGYGYDPNYLLNSGRIYFPPQ